MSSGFTAGSGRGPICAHAGQPLRTRQAREFARREPETRAVRPLKSAGCLLSLHPFRDTRAEQVHVATTALALLFRSRAATDAASAHYRNQSCGEHYGGCWFWNRGRRGAEVVPGRLHIEERRIVGQVVANGERRGSRPGQIESQRRGIS